MDLINKLLNILLPPISFILLLFFLPPFLVFKLISYIERSIHSENVAGKVILITGASSGIGEFLAYEYARRGACLALVARRENRIRAVANKARRLGCPDVIVIAADVSKVEDCKRFIYEATNHFGKLDHLVNNAGVLSEISALEDSTQISASVTDMDTNFWGSARGTHFAIPHLRKSKGKIIAISSAGGWAATPKMSIYNASKAALVSFYETLRTEFGSDIGITIVTPGLIDTEMTHDEMKSKTKLNILPAESAERCAKAIVNSAVRGDMYLTEPSWLRWGFLFKVLCPEVVAWVNRLVFATTAPKVSKKNV